MKVYVPTRNRTNRRLQTLEAFPMAILVVPVGQKVDYRKAFPRHRVLECPSERIAGTRQWILDQVGIGKMLMLDDDLNFFVRDKTGRRFTAATEADHERLYDEVSAALDDYAQVGIVDRFMSHLTPRGCMIGGKHAQLLGYNTALFPEKWPRFDRMETNEDIDFSLQLASNGYYPKILTEWTKESRYYAPGGCAVWRTPEVEFAALQKFASMWPGVVRIVPAHKKLCGYKPVVRWPRPEKDKGLLK